MKEKKYNIEEISTLSGLSRRTIRFYVQKGLLPPPKGKGRGHYYEEKHLEILNRIIELKESELSLDEVKSAIISGKAEKQKHEIPKSELWLRIPIDENLEIVFKSGTYKATPARIKKLVEEIEKIFPERSI